MNWNKLRVGTAYQSYQTRGRWIELSGPTSQNVVSISKGGKGRGESPGNERKL